MGYYVRMIMKNGTNIDRFRELQTDALDADIFSTDLKTTNNCISTWLIDDIGNLEEAIIAITSVFDVSDTVPFIYFSDEDFRETGLEVKKSEGNTMLIANVPDHYDICSLTYEGLGKVARCYKRALLNDRCEIYKKDKIKALLQNAFNNGWLKPDFVSKNRMGIGK